MSALLKYGWDGMALTVGAWRIWRSYNVLWPALFLFLDARLRRSLALAASSSHTAVRTQRLFDRTTAL